MKRRGDTYLTYSQAIFAAEVPDKHVRHWLDRHEVTFDADVARGEGHRRFSELDCVRMALISRLKHFGYEKDTAAEEVESMIRSLCEKWKIQYYGKRDNITIVDALSKTIVIFYLSGPFVVTGEDLERLRDYLILEKRKVKNPAKLYGPLTDIPKEADIRLVIDVAAIVDGIFQRLETILKE